MPRRLPAHRTHLRLFAIALLPAYLLLWVAGTGCAGSLYWFDDEIEACYFAMTLLLDPTVTLGDWFHVMSVRSGVNVYLPYGYITVNGIATPQVPPFMARLDLYNPAGTMINRFDMNLDSNGSVFGETDLPAVMIAPGSRLGLYLYLEALLNSFSGTFNYQPMVESREMPTLRFPESAKRAKFNTAFEAEFGIPYEIPAGTLIFDGSVAAAAGSRAALPKKVIVEVAHLDDDGKVQSRHKQVIKIKKANGNFKTSRKAFKGIDLDAGESVRLRLKVKGGDMAGLDWSLMPTLNS